MWEIWLITSGVFFGAAGYYMIKRRQFHYAPKEVLYSRNEETKKPAARPADVAPIDAEYTMSGGTRTQEPVAPPSFFAEMGGAVEGAKSDTAERATTPYANDNAAVDEEKNREKEKFRNLRFFDS